MSKALGFLLVALLISAPTAHAAEIFAVTPTGTAEVVFPGKATEVIAKISGRCMDVRWTVISSSGNELVCEAPLSMGQSVMGQMLLGNSYSTPPRRFFRFNAMESGGISRVQSSGWMETQMPFGQVKRVEFSGAGFHNNVMFFMISAGGKYPLGTTFPNHVVMGFITQVDQSGRHFRMRVKEVTEHTPASRAGLIDGDEIVRIAGRKFKTEQDYFDALAKATKTASYTVDVVRDGQPVALTLEREFRPAVSEVVVAVQEEAHIPQQLTMEVSVADELTKLLKLRTDGILTEAEFESQKQKILSR